MTYKVYILYSAEMDRYYVGYASNIEDRMQKHLSNHNGYTSKAKDWVIVYKENFDTKAEAYKRERQIKSWKSRKKIEELVG